MNSLVQYYRCPERYARVAQIGTPSAKRGFFRFGQQTLYGTCSGIQPAAAPDGSRGNAIERAQTRDEAVCLPFDLDQVVDNLRNELYSDWWSGGGTTSPAAKLYYLIRPILPVAIRKHLQKMRLSDWDKRPFPRWPVDRTVDDLMEQLLLLAMDAQNVNRIPFIWFWPEGATGCAVMTHDIETSAGVDFCPALMDINDSFGISASFQVVPEERYNVTQEFLDSLRARGFEVAVHDLNHDGHLFRDRKSFSERVAKINMYGKQFGATGFRAGVLYRNQKWFDLLDFEYDMSVPNVAHLDPQRGGCCTVMPYFVGKVLEIPVTMTQDYSLFHILKNYSTGLWEQQIELILEKHGLINLIAHPDYLTGEKEQRVYEAFLARLSQLRQMRQLWITIPGEVNRWWRQRAEMTIVESDGQLKIEGPGKERARIAYATKKDGRLSLDLQRVCVA